MGIKILGISASYRKKSGTFEAVKKALEGAKSIEEAVETEIIALRDKKILPCIHCDVCYKKKSLCVLKDDFLEVLDKFLEADAYIIGSPVYEMSYTPMLAAFFSRIRCTYLVNPGHYTRRIGTGVAVGGHRNGGQEMLLNSIYGFYHSNDILTCGGTFNYPGGICLCSTDGSYAGALQDIRGMQGAYEVGQRLAQLASFLKLGEEKYIGKGYKVINTEGWYAD